MANNKIKNHIDEILAKMEADDKALYSDLIDYCLSIGLKPKKVYKKDVIAVDLINRTDSINMHNNQLILRFGILKDGSVFTKLRYHASENYSEDFHQAIREEINAFKGKWVGCYHCGVGEKNEYYNKGHAV